MAAIVNGNGLGLSDGVTTVFFNGERLFSYPSLARVWNQDPPPLSRAAARLREIAEEIEALQRKMARTSRHELVHRIARLEGERKLLSDQRSRARRPPPKTQRKTTQRLQTAQAAMDARLAAGCCR